MSDLAFDLLSEKLRAHQGKGLWVVDENLPINAAIPVPNGVQCLTNRYDVAALLREKGFTVTLNDFDFSVYDKQFFDAVYYRVSKEKPVVHRVINQLPEYLKPEGCFYLSGFKKEGAKTYIDKAGRYLGAVENKVLGGKTSMIATIVCEGEPEEPLDDKSYTEFCTIETKQGASLSSKPGVYGWQKEDRGSAFLIEHLPQVIKQLSAELDIKSIADIGCGYGYLTVMAAQHIEAKFFASDNNVAAVASCQENFKNHQLNGEVSLDDCGAAIPKGMDLVLCNPPFHQGFDIDSDLTTRFIRAASRVLNTGAYAFFVVNAFIPLETKATRYFSKVEMIANNRSFKLLLLKK